MFFSKKFFLRFLSLRYGADFGRSRLVITYMDKLIEHNENLDTPVHLPSHLESLREKPEYFEIPDLETKILLHNNPHY